MSYFKKLLCKYPNWKWKREELFPTENGCILKWRAEIPKDGQSKIFFGMDIVEIEDQLITRNEVYFDTRGL